MRKLIMLAVLGAGLALAPTSDAKAQYYRGGYGGYGYAPYYGGGWGGGWHAPRYRGAGWYGPRYHRSFYSPWGYGRFGGWGYAPPRRSVGVFVAPGGFGFSYQRFRW